MVALGASNGGGDAESYALWLDPAWLGESSPTARTSPTVDRMGGRKRGRATAAVSRDRLWEGRVERPMRQRKGNESTYGGIAATPSLRLCLPRLCPRRLPPSLSF